MRLRYQRYRSSVGFLELNGGIGLWKRKEMVNTSSQTFPRCLQPAEFLIAGSQLHSPGWILSKGLLEIVWVILGGFNGLAMWT